MSEYRTGQFAREEIESQATAWQALIPLITGQAESIRSIFAGVDDLILAGCGSSLNASLSGAAILQMQAGMAAHAHPAADVFLFPDAVVRKGRTPLALLLSRSGETTEVLLALEYLRAQGVRTVGITCQAASPLARRSDLALVLSPAAERSVVTTRSFTGMVLVLQLLAAILSRDAASLDELGQLPGACQERMQLFHRLGSQVSQHPGLERLAFVANAPYFGLARECQLKIKEMTLLPVDAYPLLDFRHGPQSNVNSHMLVAALLSDTAFSQEVQFLMEMKARGAAVWALCELANPALRACADYLVELNTGIGELGRGPLYLPAIHYLAYERSLALGFNPDQPPNLTYWVDTSTHTTIQPG
jgi:glucosamine--fructose-6-phosphate aminotransferase (isomerizing)